MLSKLSSAQSPINIIISIVNTSTPLRIKGEIGIQWVLTCVNLLSLKNAPNKILVISPIIKLRDCIMSKNIKQSFVPNSRNTSPTAIMVSTVPSLTHRLTWRQESYIWCKKMPTTTSFILKPSGAHLTKSTIRPSAIMRITGKISEENLISLTTMHMSSVRTGKPVLLSESMKKVVSCRRLAWGPTVGKSKSTTPSTIRQDLALRLSAGKSINARSITLNKTGE